MIERRVRAGGVNHRLVQGDCVEFLMRDDTVYDVVVTSPPYNVGTTYGRYDDKGSRLDYLDWCHAWLAAIAERLAGDGSFFLNVGGVPSDPMGPFDVAQAARQYFEFQNIIVWVKSIAVPGDKTEVVHGHYQPINSPRYLNACHEYIFHLTRSGSVSLDRLSIGVPYKDSANKSRWRSAGDVHCRGNAWFLPYDTIQLKERDRPHPASFPLSLPATCIRLHGISKIRSVLDPFAGIGTVAAACASLGVPSTSCEIEPSFLEIAEERLVKSAAANP